MPYSLWRTTARCALVVACCTSLLTLWHAGIPSCAASDLRRTAIVKAVERVSPSVVNIHGEKQLTPQEAEYAAVDGNRLVNGMGTGVVIDERGYILTNHHVIDGVRTINVTLAGGDTYTGRLISRDTQTDLAVIKIDTPSPLPVIPIGTSSDLMRGEPVIAVGNAYGYEHTVTVGIISALKRTVDVGEGQTYENLIQTDASINPGNSGGPLLNIDGDLIGINVAVRAGAQGIGFAIASDRAMAVATKLLSVRRVDNLWHGLEFEPDVQSPKGLKVTHVEQGSPAAASGVKPGDIVTTLDGRRLSRPLDIERLMIGHRRGDEFHLQIQRDSQPVTVSLALAEAPTRGNPSEDPIWETIGLRLRPVPTKQFEQLGTQYSGGLSVVAVRPNGPAAQEGIRRGDILVGMHIWETVSLENVNYILNRADFKKFDPLKFYILRNNRTLYGHLPMTGLERR